AAAAAADAAAAAALLLAIAATLRSAWNASPTRAGLSVSRIGPASAISLVVPGQALSICSMFWSSWRMAKSKLSRQRR
ncbi:hypothetical protein BX661DRAFT_69811, partial [Kickxella alabastrina]|uniref:uncharacterized protein n=1 Tax=Kickxella alabastrina TaxID=61397 RepID=UPI0022201107